MIRVVYKNIECPRTGDTSVKLVMLHKEISQKYTKWFLKSCFVKYKKYNRIVDVI